MPQHLKMFEWLSYGGLGLAVVSELLQRPPVGEAIGIAVVVLIVAALIWAAARKGAVWAAWVLVFFAIVGLVSIIPHFTGAQTPQWLNWARPETPPTTTEKVLDVASAIMSIAGLYFYFFGNRQSVPWA